LGTLHRRPIRARSSSRASRTSCAKRRRRQHEPRFTSSRAPRRSDAAPRKNNPQTEVTAIATAAGALLALAILAVTVGLIRGEGTGDLRTHTAAGATSRIRRTLTANTAGALALLGAMLGIAGAYIALAARYHDDLGYLSDLPLTCLALAVVGVPLAAAAAGWLLAGREPPAIARPVIE
jgi:putative ABC transport system permease protein